MAVEKIQPIYLRREEDPDYEPEIWQPNWNCFYCEDTGIAKHAARLFMDDYIEGKHLFPVCQNPACETGKLFGQTPSLRSSIDWRLEASMCEEADEVQRKIWRDWAKEQQKKKMEIDLSTIGKNLRMRSRTSQESMDAKRRHSDIIER